jgi:hypothetical protein
MIIVDDHDGSTTEINLHLQPTKITLRFSLRTKPIYEWVLPVYRYDGLEPLLATLAEKVIAPAEAKVKALEQRRREIEAELTKTSL